MVLEFLEMLVQHYPSKRSEVNDKIQILVDDLFMNYNQFLRADGNVSFATFCGWWSDLPQKLKDEIPNLRILKRNGDKSDSEDKSVMDIFKSSDSPKFKSKSEEIRSMIRMSQMETALEGQILLSVEFLRT